MKRFFINLIIALWILFGMANVYFFIHLKFPNAIFFLPGAYTIIMPAAWYIEKYVNDKLK
jgi:hypothetical protein